MTGDMPRKEKLTLDELIHAMQNAWIRFRDAQLYAFVHAAPVLVWARENETDFLTYCKRNGIVGETHETRVVELMLAVDPEGEAISRERRAEYGNNVGWFADPELCPETDPDKAVALARQKGRITGIAMEYREKKDAANPKLKAAKRKVQETKARRGGFTRASAATSENVAEVPGSNKPEFLKRRVEGSSDARNGSSRGGINPLEPIVPDPVPPKLGMSDEKKLKARELVERVFHPRNTVGDTVNFVWAYHRLAYGWLPSDLDIGSYEQQLANMRERLKTGLNDAIRDRQRIAELERENAALRAEIDTLKAAKAA